MEMTRGAVDDYESRQTAEALCAKDAGTRLHIDHLP
jgi:hypothetical protein